MLRWAFSETFVLLPAVTVDATRVALTTLTGKPVAIRSLTVGGTVSLAQS